MPDHASEDYFAPHAEPASLFGNHVAHLQEPRVELPQEKIMLEGEDRIRGLALAVLSAAIHDHEQDVPKYDERNTGKRLIERLDLNRFRPTPRGGDTKYVRQLYSALRFLVKTNAALDAEQ